MTSFRLTKNRAVLLGGAACALALAAPGKAWATDCSVATLVSGTSEKLTSDCTTTVGVVIPAGASAPGGEAKAAPHEAVRVIELVKRAHDAPQTSARQGGARKEKAAREGRPEFQTRDMRYPPRIAAGPPPGKGRRGRPPPRPRARGPSRRAPPAAAGAARRSCTPAPASVAAGMSAGPARPSPAPRRSSRCRPPAPAPARTAARR